METGPRAAGERWSSWTIMLCAAAILMITMGIRQTSGLFIDPINTSTGLGIVAISFALAIAQFVWGLVQPLFGAIADKHGPRATLVSGALLLVAGLALTPFAAYSEWGLVLTMGIVTAAGAGAGSFSVLIGASAQRLSPDRRSFAAGFINAGGSFGQFVFAPFVQAVISSFGWIVAMFALAASALVTIPLSWLVSRDVPAQPAAGPLPSSGLMAQIRTSMGDRSYLCLHAGFFTCGFHIAFLVTHLPGEVALCGQSAAVSATSIGLIGLFNIAGSLCAGWLGNFCRMKYILAVMYASRAVIIAIYLISPRDPITFYVFAAALGFTWLATVPPTAGLVAKLFGTRYLATLFGLTLLSHQIGGFFGAWLGGLAVARTGTYQLMWYADILLALLAALINLPIREAKVRMSASDSTQRSGASSS